MLNKCGEIWWISSWKCTWMFVHSSYPLPLPLPLFFISFIPQMVIVAFVTLSKHLIVTQLSFKFTNIHSINFRFSLLFLTDFDQIKRKQIRKLKPKRTFQFEMPKLMKNWIRHFGWQNAKKYRYRYHLWYHIIYHFSILFIRYFRLNFGKLSITNEKKKLSITDNPYYDYYMTTNQFINSFWKFLLFAN